MINYTIYLTKHLLIYTLNHINCCLNAYHGPVLGHTNKTPDTTVDRK